MTATELLPVNDEPRPLVELRDVVVEYAVAARELRAGTQRLRAVDHVSLTLEPGETVALVGESGSGKTTLGRTLMRLVTPTSGAVRFDGLDIAGLRGQALHAYRHRVQMVFQDPYASLNPRMKVEEIIAEPLRAHRLGDRAARRARVRELLDLVGLPVTAGDRFPHMFSGGQRQRIGIARALALSPDLLVADEPVSALDVSIQAQIINLLLDLRRELRLTLLVIAHDLAVVRQLAPRIVVMYLGQIVESGTREAIFERPAHPYTRALLDAVPQPDPVIERARLRQPVRGDAPSPIDPPSGCRFHPRCPHAMDVCHTTPPAFRAHDGRMVACHLHTQVPSESSV